MRKKIFVSICLVIVANNFTSDCTRETKRNHSAHFRQRRMVGRIEKGRQSLWVQNPIYLRRCQKPQGNLLHQDYLSRRSYQSNHWQ